MRTLYLIRHGRTEANEKHLYCGSSDLPLSRLGREELEILRPAYTDMIAKKAVLFGSGMIRTDETLTILFGRNADTVLPGFREVDFGMFEGQSHDMLLSCREYLDWLQGDNFANLCPGGESGKIMQNRVLDAFTEMLNEEWEEAVACTHGGPIGAVMEFLFPKVYSYWYSWQPDPGHGWRIRFSEKGVVQDYLAVP